MQPRSFYAIVLTLFTFMQTRAPDALALTDARPVAPGGRSGAAWSVVEIQILTKQGVSIGNCTGALIGPHTVLTAAHCFDKSLLFTSDHLTVAFPLTPKEKLRPLAVTQFVAHPLYKSNPVSTEYDFTNADGSITHFGMTMVLRYDLAVLAFKGDTPRGFRAATLDSSRDDLSGQSAEIYGYGWGMGWADLQAGRAKTADVMEANLLRVGHATIQRYDEYADFYYNAAGANQSHLCNSDSGGPQFLLDAQGPKLIGVNAARVSLNEYGGMERCGDASIAMKVAPFYDWIVATKMTLEKGNQNGN